MQKHASDHRYFSGQQMRLAFNAEPCMKVAHFICSGINTHYNQQQLCPFSVLDPAC